MRCEDVQRELACDSIPLALRESVASHVGECPACGSAQIMYEWVNDILRQAPPWEPPPGFALRVSIRAAEDATGERARDLFPLLNAVNAAKTTALVAAAVYIGIQLVDSFAPVVVALTAPSPPVMWAWVALSYSVAVWLVRRART